MSETAPKCKCCSSLAVKVDIGIFKSISYWYCRKCKKELDNWGWECKFIKKEDADKTSSLAWDDLDALDFITDFDSFISDK